MSKRENESKIGVRVELPKQPGANARAGKSQ